MNIEQIQEAIEEGAEAVGKLIESEADRRVNMAKAKWDADLPGLVEAGVNERLESEKQQREKADQLQGQYSNMLEERNIKPDLVEPFMPDFGALAQDEQAESKLAEVVERAEAFHGRILKEKYGGRPPAGGGSRDSFDSDPAATEFRKAMGLTD